MIKTDLIPTWLQPYVCRYKAINFGQLTMTYYFTYEEARMYRKEDDIIDRIKLLFGEK